MIGALFQRCCNRYAREACVKHRAFNTSAVLCKKAVSTDPEVIWPQRPQRKRHFIPQDRIEDRRESKPGGPVVFPADTDEKLHFEDEVDNFDDEVDNFDDDEDLDDDWDDDWEYSANDTIDQLSQELPNFQLTDSKTQSADAFWEMSSIKPSRSALHDQVSSSSANLSEEGVRCVCGQTFPTERGMKIHRGKMKCLFKSHTTQTMDHLSANLADVSDASVGDPLPGNILGASVGDPLPGNILGASVGDPLPGNILGDLEYLFGASDHKQVDEEELLDILGEDHGADPPNYDITVYHNISDGQAESYVLEGDLAGSEGDLAGAEEDLGIPVNHVLHYIRENKGVNTSVLEVSAVHVKYVIVSSVLNKRQLKHIGAGLASLCKHEYSAVWSDPVGANTGDEWVSLDTGTCAVHFMTEEERERVNIESFWLGQDKEDEGSSQDRYTQDLVEGLFPDEDFTKLAEPWELQYEED